MFTVYIDKTCVHSDKTEARECKLINPKLTLEDNSSGSFSFKMPPINLGYNSMDRLKSFVHVFKNDTWLWSGRVVDETKDIWNNRSITCEGVLGFFNDTFESQSENSNGLTVRQRLEQAVSNHNTLCTRHNEPHKVITVDAVTVTGDDNSTLFVTNFENTMEFLNENFIKRYGGHFIIKNNGDVLSDTFSWKLDYYRDEDLPNLNQQIIQFGINLIDYTQTWDINDLATAVIPIGATMDDEDSANNFQTIDRKYTIAPVNNNVEYLYSAEAVRNFGFIQKILDYNDIDDPATLKSLGERYLREAQFETLTLELTAVDLNYLNPDIETLKLHDKVRCISHPHGMDRVFPVTKIVISLDNPEDTTYQLGSTELVKGLSTKNSNANSELKTQLRETPTKKSVLIEAKEAATSLMNLISNGYITIVTNDNGTQELYISDSPDYTEATRLWRWNINGLAYSNDGGRTYGLAMTMDGSIVADYINTGTLTADIVRTGILRGITGNSYWNLDTGFLYVDGELFSTGRYANIRVQGGELIFVDKNNGSEIAKISVNDEGQMTVTADDGVLFSVQDFDVYSDSGATLYGDDLVKMSADDGDGATITLRANGTMEVYLDEMKVHSAGSSGYYYGYDGDVITSIGSSSITYVSEINDSGGGISWYTVTRDVFDSYSTHGVKSGIVVD